MEGSVKGAELYVGNGESVSLFPPDSEHFQEGCKEGSQEGWTCHWRQLLGPKVQLDGCKIKKPTFQAPDEGLDKLLFEVTLENDVDVITDTVLVFVGEVLGEVEASLGESVATDEDRAGMHSLGKVIGPKVDEMAEAMDVGQPVADAELESWTAEAEPISMEMARGREMDIAAAETTADPEQPEGPVMPKQGFAKMLTMVRGWIGPE